MVMSVGALRALGSEHARRLLAEVAPDHVLANADEAEFLGLDDQDFLIGSTVVVKHGPLPATVRIGCVVTEVPVPPVPEVRDTTGAGDAFAAGYLSAIICGDDPVEACRAGNSWAREALGRAGAL